jgi:hypothetical protein
VSRTLLAALTIVALTIVVTLATPVLGLIWSELRHQRFGAHKMSDGDICRPPALSMIEGMVNSSGGPDRLSDGAGFPNWSLAADQRYQQVRQVFHRLMTLF